MTSKLAQLRKALANLVDKPFWNKTRLLQVTQKKFITIIKDIDALFHERSDKPAAASGDLVYVSLYHRGGMAIADWENTLRSIKLIAPGRPVFESEEEARALIAAMPNSYQQAYIALEVTSEDVLKPGGVVSRNMFDKKAIILKPSAYKDEKIKKFIHLNQVYSWVNGRLVKMPD